jgi:hypothetical protein
MIPLGVIYVWVKDALEDMYLMTSYVDTDNEGWINNISIDM